MNIFNLWYYSFSPSVADYEREQPWLQQTVKAAIYPLLGILTISEKAYASMPGEYGAVTAGIVASSMIGAVYFWPAAFAAERFGKQKRVSYRVMTILVGAGIFASVISVLAANSVVMMITTSFLVLTVVTISALSSARLIRHVTNRIIKK
jgi:peptide/nickel transport system substrate-binding protein